MNDKQGKGPALVQIGAILLAVGLAGCLIFKAHEDARPAPPPPALQPESMEGSPEARSPVFVPVAAPVTSPRYLPSSKSMVITPESQPLMMEKRDETFLFSSKSAVVPPPTPTSPPEQE